MEKVETNEKSILNQEKSTKILVDKTNTLNKDQNQISAIFKKLVECTDDLNQQPAKVFMRLPSKTRKNNDYFQKITFPISFQEIGYSVNNHEYRTIEDFQKGRGSTN